MESVRADLGLPPMERGSCTVSVAGYSWTVDYHHWGDPAAFVEDRITLRTGRDGEVSFDPERLQDIIKTHLYQDMMDSVHEEAKRPR